MWGLEYLLLFGLPENKVEVWDGKTRCAFPFLQRDAAEEHFAQWLETLCRWQGVPRAEIREEEERLEAAVGGADLRLYRRPIELRLPLDVDVLIALDSAFWRRELWEGQPEGKETGWSDRQGHWDVVHNLWRLFETVRDQVGGRHCGRVDLALTDTTNVAPDHFYFAPGRKPRMIEDDYFWDVPDLVAEVLSPATRTIDRGIRKDLYCRAGVRHLWLLDPELEQLEVYELAADRYHRVSTYSAGQTFRPALFPEIRVTVDELFDTQLKRHPEWRSHGEVKPVPDWLTPEEKRLGLEYLLLLGHPERRHEIWEDHTPCMLAFGSEEEACLRFRHFLEDASRWEQTPVPDVCAPEPGIEVAQIGRFRLTRRDRRVYLDVTVDARLYRSLLETWTRREAWDWGEEA